MNSHALSAILPKLSRQVSAQRSIGAALGNYIAQISRHTKHNAVLRANRKSGGELLLGPIAHCTASTALANSTKRLSPAEQAQMACVKADTPGIEVCLGEIFLRLKNRPRVN